MCGICGAVGPREPFIIKNMTESQAHRGPDNTGHYQFQDLSLGHNRLSIIDLSKEADQPLGTEDGKMWITYNGEIYNHREIRRELEQLGVPFRTNVDAEVVLKAYRQWGPKCLQRFNGMFALGILDQRDNSLFVARDRVGIKPLYMYQKAEKILFGSEIKSILASGLVEKQFNADLLPDYLMLRYVPGRDTFFTGISKFPPGHFGLVKNGKLYLESYWELPAVDGATTQNYSDYAAEFAELMEDSVRLRLMSDVPFGMYLSGGIDSTVILALMTEFMSEPVRTFSVDFVPSTGEGSAAAGMAAHYGADHTSFNVSEKDLSFLPQILHHLDEPQGDAIILPSFKLSQAASKQVKMVLTGEGADEILTGYQFFKVVHYLHKYPVLARILHALLRISPQGLMNKMSNHPGQLGQKSRDRVLDVIGNRKLSYIDKLNRLMMLFDPAEVGELMGIKCSPEVSPGKYNLKAMQHYIFGDWLPNNILWRQDRMTMANSIEGRVPFLDHRLVEFAFRLPDHEKISRFVDKKILRSYSRKKIPAYNHRKRKQPFYIPLDHYIQTEIMQDFIHTHITRDKIEQHACFQWKEISRIIDASRDQDFLHAKQLFSILMFQMWYDTQFNHD